MEIKVIDIINIVLVSLNILIALFTVNIPAMLGWTMALMWMLLFLYDERYNK